MRIISLEKKKRASIIWMPSFYTAESAESRLDPTSLQTFVQRRENMRRFKVRYHMLMTNYTQNKRKRRTLANRHCFGHFRHF